jgi:hypothetical protein
MTSSPYVRSPRVGLLLLALIGSPLAWTLHLLVGYLIVTLACATGWQGADLAIGVLTVLCVGMAAASGVLALRLWRQGQSGLRSGAKPGGPQPWDARMGERGARSVFLAVLGVLMAGMFAYLILLQGMPPLFTPTCPAISAP